MPFLQELLGGGAQKPTAQEMAGGIPQNADPGKRPLGNGLMGLRGAGGGGGAAPPPVTPAQTPDIQQAPAQLMPQGAPIPATAAPPAAMGGMGGPPMGGGGAIPMGGAALGDYGGGRPPADPQMLQALMARMQGGGR